MPRGTQRSPPVASATPRTEVRSARGSHGTSAARGIAAHSLAAQAMRDDGTPLALRPDADFMDGLLYDMDAAVEDGRNKNTRKGELSAWRRYYAPYCKLLRTSPWRGFATQQDPLRESVFGGGFAVFVDRLIRPRRKADKLARAGSVRGIVAHIRRMHDRKGFGFASSRMISHVLRGMARRRLREGGLQLPVRAEPFTAEENVAMKDIPPGAVIAGRTYDPDALLWANWRKIDTFADQTGIRKSEAVGDDDFFISEADVRVVVDGKTYADPSDAVLRRMRAEGVRRDLVLVTVNVSKADFDGSRFGPNVVALLYNPDNPMSFAAAWLECRLKFPLAGAARFDTPLFTTGGDKRWTGPLIDRVLSGVMTATLTPAQRKGKTFHSKRVWAASGFTSINSSESETMALVRWATPESLRVYARMHLGYQAQRRDALRSADVYAVNATMLPTVDPVPADAPGFVALADELDVDD